MCHIEGVRILRDVVKVIPLEDYRLEVWFDDGQRATVDIKPLMHRQVFRPLWDENIFSRVEINHKFGGVIWPTGADVCVDWIEAEIGRQRPRASYG